MKAANRSMGTAESSPMWQELASNGSCSETSGRELAGIAVGWPDPRLVTGMRTLLSGLHNLCSRQPLGGVLVSYPSFYCIKGTACTWGWIRCAFTLRKVSMKRFIFTTRQCRPHGFTVWRGSCTCSRHLIFWENEFYSYISLVTGTALVFQL